MAVSHHVCHSLLVRNKSYVPPILNYTRHGYWKVEGGDIFGGQSLTIIATIDNIEYFENKYS